jgi:hypothetical protein
MNQQRSLTLYLSVMGRSLIHLMLYRRGVLNAQQMMIGGHNTAASTQCQAYRHRSDVTANNSIALHQLPSKFSQLTGHLFNSRYGSMQIFSACMGCVL